MRHGPMPDAYICAAEKPKDLESKGKKNGSPTQLPSQQAAMAYYEVFRTEAMPRVVTYGDTLGKKAKNINTTDIQAD